MSLPTVTEIQTAVTNVFNALKDGKFKAQSAQEALYTFQEVIGVLRQIYARRVLNVTVTNETDASVAAAIAATGQLGIAYALAYPKNPTFPVGELFKVSGTGDFTSDALATAKGGAPAAGDIFQITSGTTVKFIGAAQPNFAPAAVSGF
jgi:hypothetical protein